MADEDEVPNGAEASRAPILSVVYRLQVPPGHGTIARAHMSRCSEHAHVFHLKLTCH
jgi:hypothetical protein